MAGSPRPRIPCDADDWVNDYRRRGGATLTADVEDVRPVSIAVPAAWSAAASLV